MSSLGVRAQVKEIYVNGTRSSCGFVTHKTRTIFRSETAKCFIFIQMSRDMWEFDEDGDMFAEKCVHGFLPDLFSRWKTSGSNHVVSIILFSRIFYEKEKEEATNMFVQDAEEGKKDKDGNDIGISVDAFGRYYRDFYRVVVDWETRANWASVLIPIKKEFVKFQKDVLERRDTSGSTILSGTNSYSSEGNVLEAINLALNPFDKHYIDRDLIRTGLSVVVVTPGVGAFEVDRKLCRLTSQRLIDNGIGLDLVCLSKPPLYTTPLFQFMTNNVDGHFQSAQPELSSSAAGRFDKPSSSYDYKTTPEFWDPLYFDSNSTGSQRLYYWIPHWVNCSFWTRDDGVQSKGFSPRCKMPELQMAGSFEVMYSGLIVPTLLDNASISQDSTGDGINLPTGGAGLYDYDAYDDTVFSSRLASSRLMSRDESGTGIGETNTRLGVSPDSGATLGRMDINKVASVSPDFSYNTMHSIGQFVRSGDTRKKTDLDHLLKGGFGELGDEVASEDRAAFLKIKALVEQSKDTSLKSIKSNMSLVSMFSKFTVDSYQGTETMVSAKPRSGFPPRNPDASPMMEEAPDYAYTSMSPIKIRSHAREIDSHYSRGSYSTSYKAPTGSPSDLSRYIQKPSPGRLANQMSRQTIRQTFVNPCNPSKNVIKLSSHVRRWQHVYPRLAQARLSSTMDWKSLCVPACLPLTTDFFPTEDDLRNYYQEYTYTVNPADDSVYQDDSDNERRKVEALLTELISQRLAQGFQLITDVVDGKQKGGVDGVDLSGKNPLFVT